MNRKFGAFSSSVNPEEVSLTIESVIKLIGLIVGGFLAMKGSGAVINDELIKQTTDAFTVIAVSGMAVWQSANFLFGLFRKLVARG